MNLKIFLITVLLLVLLVVAIIAGMWLHGLVNKPAAIWTPAPLIGSQPTNAAILPTIELPPTAPPAQPTPIPAAPSATIVPVEQSAALTPPPFDPKRITITETDVARALAGGVGTQQGLTAEGMAVRFSGGKLHLTAQLLAYGPINVRDLSLDGVLVAQDGRLQLHTETITPSNLVTALIPGLANQALAQYTVAWYVEEAQTLEGRLEVRIR